MSSGGDSFRRETLASAILCDTFAVDFEAALESVAQLVDLDPDYKKGHRRIDLMECTFLYGASVEQPGEQTMEVLPLRSICEKQPVEQPGGTDHGWFRISISCPRPRSWTPDVSQPSALHKRRTGCTKSVLFFAHDPLVQAKICTTLQAREHLHCCALRFTSTPNGASSETQKPTFSSLSLVLFQNQFKQGQWQFSIGYRIDIVRGSIACFRRI